MKRTMEAIVALNAAYSNSYRLSGIQRVVAGGLSVLTFVVFNGLFNVLKPVGPLFFTLTAIPVTLFMLALFGGPVKRIINIGLGCTVGLLLGRVL